jgi:hypothetical protein
MIKVIDDILEFHLAHLVDDSIHNTDTKWSWHYKANKDIPSRHWHLYCGETVEEIDKNGFEYLLPLWEQIENHRELPKVKIKRCYLNAHTPGVEPSIHKDDGDVTFIYYPNLKWNVNFGGGTTIYDETLDKGTLINYKGNRLICFTASLPHQAMPVSRICHDLRTCVVFKTSYVN